MSIVSINILMSTSEIETPSDVLRLLIPQPRHRLRRRALPRPGSSLSPQMPERLPVHFSEPLE